MRNPILGVFLSVQLGGLDILVLVPEVCSGDRRDGIGHLIADGDAREERPVKKVRILAGDGVEAKVRPDNVRWKERNGACYFYFGGERGTHHPSPRYRRSRVVH